MPPRGLAKRPGARVDRAGEGAALVAEELALEQLARDRRAVHRDERAARRARSPAWIARATSSLPVPLSPVISTVDVAARATRPIVLKISCSAAAPADQPLARLVRPADLAAQARDLALERARAQRLRDQRLHLVHAERLGEVVERAALHRLDGVLERVLRGDDHDRDVAAARSAACSSSSRPERSGHADVEERDVERARPASAASAASPLVDVGHLVAGVLERLAQHEADRRLVVGDQHARAASLICAASRRARGASDAAERQRDAHPRAAARLALEVQRCRRAASPSVGARRGPSPVPPRARGEERRASPGASTSSGDARARRPRTRPRASAEAGPRASSRGGRGVMRVVMVSVPPAFVHRLQRVAREVQEHLRQPVGVGEQLGERGVEAALDAARRAAERIDARAASSTPSSTLWMFTARRRSVVAAREHHQVVDQRGDAVDLAHDQLGGLARLRVGRARARGAPPAPRMPPSGFLISCARPAAIVPERLEALALDLELERARCWSVRSRSTSTDAVRLAAPGRRAARRRRPRARRLPRRRSIRRSLLDCAERPVASTVRASRAMAWSAPSRRSTGAPSTASSGVLEDPAGLRRSAPRRARRGRARSRPPEGVEHVPEIARHAGLCGA